MPLISFGEALVDMLPGQEPKHYIACTGGAPVNVAVAFADHGRQSYFVGGLATDALGRMLNTDIQAHGVNTEYCAYFDNAPTSLVMVSLSDEGERSFSFYRDNGADTLFRSHHFNQEVFQQTSIFHLNSNTLTDESLYQTSCSGVALARQYGHIISFDLNLRLSLWSEPEMTFLPERIANMLTQAHIVKMDHQELQYIASAMKTNEQACLQHFLSLADEKVIVVTDGGNAIQAYTKDDKHSIHPPKIEVVDTTGAGDAFLGGLLVDFDRANATGTTLNSWLKTENLERALTFASQCGAKACQKKGAF